MVFDHLHAVAFQGMCPSTFLCAGTHFDQANLLIGCTILGPKVNILSIKCNGLSNYIRTNYTADHMVQVDAGGINHDELITFAEKHFSSLPISSSPIPLGHLAHLQSRSLLVLRFTSKMSIFCMHMLQLQ